MSAGRQKNPNGFTLVEAIIVMVLLGILAAVTFPGIIGSLQNLRLNQAANKLASDIRYAKENALNYHGTYGIEFDVNNNSYQLFQLVSGSKNVIKDPFSNANMVIDFDLKSEYSGVSIASASISEIRFDSFGIPYNSLDAALTSAANIVLQNGSSSKTVSITHQTSFVEIT